MQQISLILNLHNETDHQSIVPLRTSVCRTDQEALWTRQAFIKVTLIVNDTEPYRCNMEIHQTGSKKPESIIPGEFPCRYCPAKELTQQEVDYLCSDATL